MIPTAHFTEAELACKCGCGKANMDLAFMTKLEALRVEYAEPMVITSGFRCNNYNTAVKGSKSSRHMFGQAVDVAVAEPAKRFRLVELAFKHGFRGIGCDGAFVHLDTRGTEPVMWLYPVTDKG